MFFNDIAISVEGVSKRYEIYAKAQDQLKQFIIPKLQRSLGIQPTQYFREFWALQDIYLQVHKGESCGIVGLNGSGKSTLLQIITGTLFPTTGKITTHGRIAPLLELGSGFNPDFTGRENVYMNGELLGFNQDQIDSKFESIQSFADIGDHFDQPLVTYSSGMQMRVAFAVATAFDPDILIIDESLAVGDAYFQQKCFHRIERFKDNGGTLLFVSHDANAIKHLCDKAVLISQGKALCHGAPKTVIDLYQSLVAQKTDLSDQSLVVSQNQNFQSSESANSHEEDKRTWTKATTITTNGTAELIDFNLLDATGHKVAHIASETDLIVQYRIRMHKDFERPAFGLIVRDRIGRSIYETSTYAMRMKVEPVAMGKDVLVRFQFNFNLRAGQYSFSVGVANKGFSRSEFEEFSLLMHDVEQIQVSDATGTDYYGGIFNMKPKVSAYVLA